MYIISIAYNSAIIGPFKKIFSIQGRIQLSFFHLRDQANLGGDLLKH